LGKTEFVGPAGKTAASNRAGPMMPPEGLTGTFFAPPKIPTAVQAKHILMPGSAVAQSNGTRLEEGESGMRNPSGNSRRASLAVEQLEDRQLLSVTITPPVLNIKTTEHGHGVFTVRVIGDDANGKTLVHSMSLTETFTETMGNSTVTLTPKPVRQTSAGGTLLLKFKRSDLKGLGAGTVTLTVSNGTGMGSVSESATLTVFSPGSQGHGHSHHSTHGHNHG
jgi:hypothetical protein